MFNSHEKSKYWHPTKNKNLTPDKVSIGSASKCWFLCNVCDHDFESDPNHITAKKNPTWCPYCSCKKLCYKDDCKFCYDKSFASYKKCINNCDETEEKCNHILKVDCWSNQNILQEVAQQKEVEQHEEVAQQKEVEQQEIKHHVPILPRNVFKNCNTKHWFKCPECSHIFDTALNNINANKWCPYCCEASSKFCEKSKKKECTHCFDKSFASHPRSVYWDDEKNKKVNPYNITKSSSKKCWFICEKGHSFYASLGHISSEKEPRWCSICNGTGVEVLQHYQERSFSSHPRAVCFSKTLNGVITPNELFLGTHDKYWFDCECGHSFYSSINHVSDGGWCAYCCNPPKKLCENNMDKHCVSCYDKSFASYKQCINNCDEKCDHKLKVECWDITENKIEPSSAFKGDNDKYWFKCYQCNHNFQQQLNVTTKGSWCSYCSKTSSIFCEKSTKGECNHCFDKSFVSQPKSVYWDYEKNINVNPYNITKSNGNKYWFICEKGHSFYISCSNIYGGKWCCYCINKTEQKLYDKLHIIYPILKQQYKVDWCKNIRHLPFDLVLEEQNIIIELDGPQHFRNIYHKWRTPEEEQINDKYKMKCANDNGFSVIRVLQEDVFYDTYDWLNELDTSIKKLIKEKFTQNIYLCKNNEYDIFNAE